MSGKREQVIRALYHKLKSLETSEIKVYRNLDKPQKVLPGAMVILRDGESREPEVILSPLIYIYEHMATLEIIMQSVCREAIRTMLDDLLVDISSIIINNRSLDGLAEWIEAKAPEFDYEAIEGAASIHMATITIIIRFSTYDPLN